jgi:hypothetical protein
MSSRFSSAGRAASASGAGATTLTVTVDAGGHWPIVGALHTLMIRMTAGSATKYTWALFSEDPASPPTGQKWEYLLCGAFNNSGIGGEDDSVPPSGNTGIPDVFIEFAEPKAWRQKATAGSLYLVLTPDAATNNQWTTVILAGPRRRRLLPDEIPA